MWQAAYQFGKSIIDWIKKLLGKNPVATDEQQAQNAEAARRYEDVSHYTNPTATTAGIMADLAVADSTATIEKESETDATAEYFDILLQEVWDDIRNLTARAEGTGGVVVKPGYQDGVIFPVYLGQECYTPIATLGKTVTQASFIVEVKEYKDNLYQRVELETLQPDGVLVQQYARSGENTYPLSVVPDWADYPPEQKVAGANKLLYGYIKCPTDNRQLNDKYSVPITYGQDKLINMVEFFTAWLEKEVSAKTVRMGGDSSLFRKTKDNTFDNSKVDAQLAELYIMFDTDSKDKKWFEVYDPALREQSVIAAIGFINGMIEKGMGVNQGILTNMQTENATATAIKASTRHTRAHNEAMRKNIAKGLQDYIDACSAIAKESGALPSSPGYVAPARQFKIAFDWDYSLIEDSAETFLQLAELETRGLISGERLNSWVTGQEEEEALAEIARAKAAKPKADGFDLNGILGEPNVAR